MQSTRVLIHKRVVAAATIPLALISSALFAPSAQAATTSASACLKGYSGPYDVVNSYGGITLKCGDTTKGVIHIDSSHPISESGSDDVRIKQCMDNVLAYGGPVSSGFGNSAKHWRTPSGVYAYVVWRSTQMDVFTMYTDTNGGANNRWYLCD